MTRGCLWVVLLATLGARAASAQGPPAWRWTTGLGIGAVSGPGEIGSHPNATGGREQLIARLDGGLGVGLQAGFESRFGGAELRGLGLSSAVQVRNQFGVAFPHHGRRPFAWTASLLAYPLAPLQGRGSGMRPFLHAGVGGILVSVDLDNLNGQTLYHSFQWTVGGGLRIAMSPEDIPSWTPTFLELRVERKQAWSNRPLERFGLLAATVGLGMRH